MLNLFGQDFIFRLIAIVVGLVVHEFAHAYTAQLMGDKTAKHAGRVTLNPVAHLDPIGLIMILFAPFGWARPVPVNPSNFRHPRLGSILVALAGPISNLILAILCVFALRPYRFSLDVGFVPQLISTMFIINVALFIFNLIPVQPLDGSRILANLLPYRWAVKYSRFEMYGPFILLLIVIIPQTNQAIFGPLFFGTANGLASLFGY